VGEALPHFWADYGISAVHGVAGESAQERFDQLTDRPFHGYMPPVTTPVVQNVSAVSTVTALTRPAVAPPPPPPPPPPVRAAPRAPSSWLSIPSISLSYPVGTYTDCQGQAPLSYDEPSRDTCVPASEVFLVGHNPGVFEGLPNLQVGSEVRYWDPSGAAHVYHIYKITRVPKDQGSWVMWSDHPPLLMQTCVDSSAREYYYFYGS